VATAVIAAIAGKPFRACSKRCPF